MPTADPKNSFVADPEFALTIIAVLTLRLGGDVIITEADVKEAAKHAIFEGTARNEENERVIRYFTAPLNRARG